MAGWRVHSGLAVALPLDDIDTDQLIPARFMSTPRSEGYGGFLLHDLRRREDEVLREDLQINCCPEATILIAGRNFGSGSSREAAVYALADAGFRVVIATGFGDIFAANAVNNGVLPARVTPDASAALTGAVQSAPARITVRLAEGDITLGDLTVPFDLDPVWRDKLMNGWDDIDLTLRHAAALAAFRERRRRDAPWAWPQRDTTSGRSGRDNKTAG